MLLFVLLALADIIFIFLSSKNVNVAHIQIEMKFVRELVIRMSIFCNSIFLLMIIMLFINMRHTNDETFLKEDKKTFKKIIFRAIGFNLFIVLGLKILFGWKH